MLIPFKIGEGINGECDGNGRDKGKLVLGNLDGKGGDF